MYTVKVSLMVLFAAMVYTKIGYVKSMEEWDPSSSKSRELAEILVDLLNKKEPDMERYLERVMDVGFDSDKKKYVVKMKVCSDCNQDDDCDDSGSDSCDSFFGHDSSDDEDCGCSEFSNCAAAPSLNLGGLVTAAPNNTERVKRSGDKMCEKCKVTACCARQDCGGRELKIKNYKCTPCK